MIILSPIPLKIASSSLFCAVILKKALYRLKGISNRNIEEDGLYRIKNIKKKLVFNYRVLRFSHSLVCMCMAGLQADEVAAQLLVVECKLRIGDDEDDELVDEELPKPDEIRFAFSSSLLFPGMR